MSGLPPGISRLSGFSKPGISVSFATIFEGNITAAQARATAPVPTLEQAGVTGWVEPNHRLTSHTGNERVEDGTTITDHIVALPARLTMKGHVSDVTNPKGSDGAVDVWQTLRRLHKGEVLLSVVTEWATYKDMAIRSIDTTQTHRGMIFTMELQEVVRVGVGYYEPTERKETAKDRSPHLPGGDNDLFTILPPRIGQSAVFLDSEGNPYVDPDGVFALLPDGKTGVYISREETYTPVGDDRPHVKPGALSEDEIRRLTDGETEAR